MNNPPILLQNAVSNLLKDFEPADLILVGCSGGADSIALAWSASVVCKRLNLNLGVVIVDHQLIAESNQVAENTKKQCAEFGINQIIVKKIKVVLENEGLEAAARKARYKAFEEVIKDTNAKALMLAHTQDDQAETMLMRLTRGSGAKSLSAMSEVSGKYLRPFLHVRKFEIKDALEKEDIKYWNDPANSNSDFLRVKVRNELIPKLIEVLGDSVVEALDRTSMLLKNDNDILDQIALDHYQENKQLLISKLEELPSAIRTRVIKLAALDAGVNPGPFSFEHIEAIDALVTNWHGQSHIDLPGFVQASRVNETIRFNSSRKSSS